MKTHKIGRWIWSVPNHLYVCSECGKNPTFATGFSHDLDFLNQHYIYCRWCGSKNSEDHND